MKLHLYIIISLFFLSSVAQDDPNTWMVNNLQEYNNLDFLDSLIGEKKYVFIGESSHGAKEFFEFRAEVIKYLVQEKNFDIVAFESPFIASYFYDNKPEWRIDSLTHMEHVLFPIFCNEINNQLIDTLNDLKIPIVGFDNQLGTEFQAINVTNFVYNKMLLIDSVCAAEYLEINTLFSKKNIVRFSKKERWFNYPCNTISDNSTCEYWLKKYEKFITTITSNYPKLLSFCNNDSIEALATLRAIQTVHTDLLTSVHDNQLFIRDSLMAENIKFLSEYVFPEKKIIFLAHNAHISKRYQNVEGNFQGDHRTMMSFLDTSISDNSLVLGLYGLQGSSNNNNREPVEMTCIKQDSTLEFQLAKVLKNKAFINVQNYPFYTPMYLCHWGKWPELINPKEQYDYLFFIKNISPSTYFEKEKTLPTKSKQH